MAFDCILFPDIAPLPILAAVTALSFILDVVTALFESLLSVMELSAILPDVMAPSMM